MYCQKVLWADGQSARLLPSFCSTYWSRSWNTGGISGVGAFVTGLISTIKGKERSILVFLAVVAGLFALIGSLDMVFDVP